jgi:hypothetical protein
VRLDELRRWDDGHLYRVRDNGTALHLAACPCWRWPALRGPVTPGDARVPGGLRWWLAYLRG